MVRGEVLKVDTRTGARPDGSKWAMTFVHILDRDALTVHECLLPDRFPGRAPRVGEVGTFSVEVSAFKRAGSGEARLSVNLISRLDEVPSARALHVVDEHEPDADGVVADL